MSEILLEVGRRNVVTVAYAIFEYITPVACGERQQPAQQ